MTTDTERTPAVQAAPDPGRPRRARFYVPVAVKLVIAVVVATLWVGVSVWISLPWVDELSDTVGPYAAWVVVVLVAYLPGFIVALMTMSLLMDRQPSLEAMDPTTGITVIVAARNEEAGIADTIRHAARSDYAGTVTLVLADNGSTDRTCEIAKATADAMGVELVMVHEPTPGKSHALNAALLHVVTPYVVTLDADTLLHRQALRRLVSRLESAPPDTVAVAGSVLVRNSRVNLLTRMQEWDYYLGIAGVKRMQGLYQSTLVAQGAFSVYLTEQVRRIGGWPDAIGEDIVVTWKLMQSGHRVYFEPTAIAFTDVPSQLRHFMHQRSRWARGMLEGLRAVPPWRQSRTLTKLVAGVDLVIPLLDIGYALVWLPGLVLFLVGVPLIVSMWTLVVLPVTLLVYGGLRTYQSRRIFAPLGLSVRRNRLGYVAFLLGYQALCSVASLRGYAQDVARTRRRWK
ncbi:MAG: glycosyltransferase family 2 protein [Actinomycetes bacterium]